MADFYDKVEGMRQFSKLTFSIQSAIIGGKNTGRLFTDSYNIPNPFFYEQMVGKSLFFYPEEEEEAYLLQKTC